MNLKLTRENIWLSLVCFTLCSFAFSERINSWGILFLSIFFLLDKNLLPKIRDVRFDKKILPPIFFFLLYLVFFLFSDMDNSAGHALFSKFTLILLPPLFYYENYFTSKNEKFILLIFSIALSCGFLYELSVSFYTNYFNTPHPSIAKSLGRMQVSKAIMHPGYYSNFLMLGIIWHYFNKSKYTVFFISIFSLALALLLSRIVLLFYLLFAIYVTFRLFKKRYKTLTSTLLVTLLGIIGLFVFSQIPTVKNRIVDTFSNLNSTSRSIDVSSATGSRRVAYEVELELIKAKPILGYGLGKTTQVLREQLNSNDYSELGKEMNNHNQYFKTWMQLGIIGIVGLLGLLFFLFSYYRKEKLPTAFWFTGLVALGLLTDDMLEIQAGIVFFVLIWSLYLSQKEALTNP